MPGSSHWLFAAKGTRRSTYDRQSFYPYVAGRIFLLILRPTGFQTTMSTQTIAVHLPDGAIREVPAGTTPFDIANAISPRLAAAAVVARLTPLAATPSHGQGTSGELAEAAMYAAEDSA
jgi:hypothetical protein